MRKIKISRTVENSSNRRNSGDLEHKSARFRYFQVTILCTLWAKVGLSKCGMLFLSIA